MGRDLVGSSQDGSRGGKSCEEKGEEIMSMFAQYAAAVALVLVAVNVSVIQFRLTRIEKLLKEKNHV
jgi:hypothetical protein